MSFKHGIFYTESPTNIVPTIKINTPTVVIGSCAAHIAGTPANTPLLISSLGDFKRQCGWTGKTYKYGLEEAAKVFFDLYNVSPLVVINVVDTNVHVRDGTKTLTGLNKTLTLDVELVLSTLTIKSGETTLTKGTDYTAAYNDDGKLVFRVINTTKITNDTATLTYKEFDAAQITRATVMNGINHIAEVFPKFGVVPSTLICPGYSHTTEVLALMKSKVRDINGAFNCVAIADLDSEAAPEYSAVNALKNDNNFIDENLIVCWPKVTLGANSYHMSCHIAAIMNRIDALEGDGVPYISPSNHSLQCDGLALKGGAEVLMPKDEADYLNSIGVVTGMNFNGWRLWGNRTSIYPSTTDPKDVFIAVRRMIQFIGNTIILTFFSYVDKPLNKRLIETVETSVQYYLNGLAAQGAILGGKITFDSSDNALTDLIDGKITFSVSIGFVVPAESITFEISFDPSLYETLFS